MSKRKRVDSTSSKGGGAPTSAKPPTKKTKLPNTIPSVAPTATYTPQPIAGLGTGRAVPTLSGRQFHKAIKALGSTSDDAVMAKVSLNLEKSSTTPAVNYQIGGTFSVSTHPTTGLTQGMMNTAAPSTYLSTPAQQTKTKFNKTPGALDAYIERNSVLPKSLSLERATAEGRVMKQLAPRGKITPEKCDQRYDSTAKTTPFAELEYTQKGTPKIGTVGGIALGSHLEDITAKRAIGVDDVGSAMRAKTMAAKWRMKTANDGVDTPNFRSSMMSSFPQLGKDGLKIGSMNDTGIAAIKTEWAKLNPVFTRQQQVQNVADANKEASDAAMQRFNDKIRNVWGSGTRDKDTGKWTGGKFKPNGRWFKENKEAIRGALKHSNSPNEDKRKAAQEKLNDLAEAYRTRKLTRHGIKT